MIYVKNQLLTATVEDILKDLQLNNTQGLLKEIKELPNDFQITCPSHAIGRENNASCGVVKEDSVRNGKKVKAGTTHCFTCNYTADLIKLTADVLKITYNKAEEYLINNYLLVNSGKRPLIENNYERDCEEKKEIEISEGLVEKYHLSLYNDNINYMKNRKITDRVIKEFKIGYNRKDKTITIPIRDKKGKIIGIKERGIKRRYFKNNFGFNKSEYIFGLSYIIKNASFDDKIWITESEIDCLDLISRGKKAISIMGSSISQKQQKLLINTSFRKFILALDNDKAGKKGCRLIKDKLIKKAFKFWNLRWNTDKKDINELTDEEFKELELF